MQFLFFLKCTYLKIIFLECLIAIRGRKWHWKHREKLLNQRQCSNHARWVRLFCKCQLSWLCGAGVLRGQAEEGRDLRGLSGLQQEDPAHSLASAGERHRGGSYQQSLSVSRELLTSSSSPSTSNVLATRVGCCCDYVAGYVSLKNEWWL